MEKINKKEVLRAIKYLLFAASAGIIQFGSFTLLNEILHLEYWVSYFIALTLSVVWNFTFNRKYTFRSVKNVPIAMLEVLAYYAVFTPASIYWGIALENVHWNEYLILSLTMIINLVTEYLFYTFVVYRNSIDSANKKKENGMGKIIVIEGTDGSGKKTQTELLYKYYKDKGENVILQSFPNYESPSSAPVKMYLNGELGENANSLDAYASSSLFAVDRVCTWQNLKEDYEKGAIIIFDRYVQSNMLHQAGKIANKRERNKFIKWLDNFEFKNLKLPRPDKVYFLDVPPAISKKLANERADLKAGTKKDIHEQDEQHLINAYNAGKEVAKKYKWITIPCTDQNDNLKSIEEIHQEILKLL